MTHDSDGGDGASDPDDSGPYPSVPHDRLLEDGWKLRSRAEETVFRLPAASVVGYTLLYEDARLRGAIEATDAVEPPAGAGEDHLVTADGDGTWRFLFATRLSFQPPLAPGIGPASLRPTVASQAKRTFAADLESRGFESVESGRGQRFRTDSGDRGRLRKFTAHLSLGGGGAIPDRIDVEGWLAVWTTDGGFRIAGGAYPASGIEAILGSASDAPPTDPGAFREELLSAIRAVG
jgi:hypothetical protein